MMNCIKKCFYFLLAFSFSIAAMEFNDNNQDMHMVEWQSLPDDCGKIIMTYAYALHIKDICRDIASNTCEYRNRDNFVRICHRLPPLSFKPSWIADMQVPYSLLSVTQQESNIILHKAVFNKSISGTRMALALGANSNAPLIVEDEIIAFLKGATALFVAVYKADVAMVCLLFENGALPNIVTAGQLTPVSLVNTKMQEKGIRIEKMQKYKDIKELLIQQLDLLKTKDDSSDDYDII